MGVVVCVVVGGSQVVIGSSVVGTTVVGGSWRRQASPVPRQTARSTRVDGCIVEYLLLVLVPFFTLPF